jgi:hypothetical protein
MTDKPDTTHYITLGSDMPAGTRGEVVVLNLICTAPPGADCRKRPAEPRETWSLDDPDLIDGECWAVEWVDAVGWWDAVGTDHTEIGRIPVAVEYGECVIVSPVEEEPADQPRIDR